MLMLIPTPVQATIPFPPTTATTSPGLPGLPGLLGLLDLVSSRISSSCSVPFPTLPAIRAIAAGLGATAASAAALLAAASSAFSPAGLGPGLIAEPFFLRLPTFSARNDGDDGGSPPRHPLLLPRPTTVIRCLLLPGLVEEVLWRVAPTPHPTVQPTVTPGPILATNACFALYHVAVAELAVRSGHHPDAGRVFRHPVFLALAFCLGNACSLAYLASGGAILAPVVVHGVAVAFWLDVLGGEEALRGGDGGKGGDGRGSVGKNGEEGVGRAVDDGEVEVEDDGR